MAQENTVAVINSNEDIVEAIQLILADEGYHSVGAHVIDFKKGRKDFVTFCKEHNPQVIIFDIAPPYEENWTFLQLIKNAKEVEGRKFIITTTNKGILEKFVGKTDAIEIVGKPFDMEEIVTTVKKKLKS
jgi:DNA-binding NtrC family response regulator